MNVIFTGIIDSIRTLKDKSLKLVIESQEPDNETISKLIGFNGNFIKILFSDKNIIPEQVEAIESFKVEEECRQKSKPETKSSSLRELAATQ
jgi:hypothetical protein